MLHFRIPQVLGSLACLSDVPEWAGQPRPQPQRLPRDDIILELDVATFTSNVRPYVYLGLILMLRRLQPTKVGEAVFLWMLRRYN